MRTRHVNEDGTPRYTNRLAQESSPYLQQHAHNPVAWRAWGDDAFREARETGKPILLSVGYSTCHWCHVMEEESFEDEEVAQAMNDLYVPIKVDREERPDVDAIYMTAVQAMTGHGGWPMTVWLKSDGRPYYGGTYFPARDGDRGTRTGFLTLVKELARLHQADPARVEQAAKELTSAVQQRLSPLAPGGLPDAATLGRAFKYYQRSADRTFGGMMGAPKFPSSLPVRFLLRYHQRFGEPEALAIAEHALAQMARGGINDQIGGGFHRYAVDEMWLVPHFEKMLYDNALLASAYVEAWQATKKPLFEATARETLDYVLREMTADQGAFYSATDADSPNPDKAGERDEGWFFTWTPRELEDVLGPADARVAAAAYGVEPEGNFEGRTVLARQIEMSELKTALNLTEAEIEDTLRRVKVKLFQARSYRPAPLLDDKILAAWNGLMISAMAKAGEAFGEPRYLDAATRAARFVLMSMTIDGRLQRSFGKGKAQHEAYLEDYAFVAQGLLDLYEATLAKEFLTEATRLADLAHELFTDAARGGYFATSNRGEPLIVREKTAHDGATPSGSSVFASVLLRLSWLTSRAELRQRAEGIFRSFDQILQRMPAALSEMLIAADYLLGPVKQVQLKAPRHLDDLTPLRQALGRRFVPRRTVVAEVDPAVPAATVMICNDTTCNLPTTKIPEFESQL